MLTDELEGIFCDTDFLSAPCLFRACTVPCTMLVPCLYRAWYRTCTVPGTVLVPCLFTQGMVQARGGYACPTRKGRTQACVPWVKWSNAQRKRAFSGSIKPFFGQKTARFRGKSGKIKKRRTQISKVPNAERTQTQNARF